MKIKIYCGLCLVEEEVHKVLPDAIVAPPMKRGQILSDIESGVNVIGIADGSFHQAHAVSVNELRDGLRCGIAIYGSSSMGALRAAELASYGMHGSGKIFEYITQSECFRDDFVGQVYSAHDDTLIKLSIPWVDFFFYLESKRAEQLLDLESQERLLALFTKLDYPDRTSIGLENLIKAEGTFSKEVMILAKGAFTQTLNQKKRDGQGMLELIKKDIRRVEILNANFDLIPDWIPPPIARDVDL